MPEYTMKVPKQFQQFMSSTIDSNANPAENSADLMTRALALYTYLHENVDVNPDFKVAIVDGAGQIIMIIDDLP